jgi:hypothetical protein
VQLSRLGMFQGHEMMDHPMAAVYAAAFHGCDTKQSVLDALIAHLKHSDDSSSFSQAMASKTVFPLWHRDFPRHFVVLVDARQGAAAADDVAKVVAAVSKAAAAAIGNEAMVKVSAVTINEGSGGTEEAGAKVAWSDFRHSNLSCPGRHRVVACAGEAFQHVQMEAASAGARGGWLSQQNLDDVTAVVNAILRARPPLALCATERCSAVVCVTVS